jgi:hypothetical protein
MPLPLPVIVCLMQVEHPAVDIHLVGIPWVETLYNTCLVIFSGIHAVVRLIFFEEALRDVRPIQISL